MHASRIQYHYSPSSSVNMYAILIFKATHSFSITRCGCIVPKDLQYTLQCTYKERRERRMKTGQCMCFTGRSVLRRKEEEVGELGQLQLNLNAIHEGWLVQLMYNIYSLYIYAFILCLCHTSQSAINSTWI